MFCSTPTPAMIDIPRRHHPEIERPLPAEIDRGNIFWLPSSGRKKRPANKQFPGIVPPEVDYTRNSPFEILIPLLLKKGKTEPQTLDVQA